MKYARWCERGKPRGDPLLDTGLLDVITFAAGIWCDGGV